MINHRQPAVALPWLRDMLDKSNSRIFQNMQEYWPAPAFRGIPINNAASYLITNAT